MAFQTSILRDGEWVTETVDLQAALKASAAPKATGHALPVPPACGVISRTIVESPIVQWILPVRLRSETHNDIAFIGDHFVQINELGRDGQIHEVVRKSNFGSRIRGAVVLGDSLQHGLDDDDAGNLVKTEEQDLSMEGLVDCADTGVSALPPQLLVLMLESGDTVYLFLKKKQDSSLDFILSRYPSPKNLSYLGYHLSVDPSSRYMAAASPDGILVIYELESMANLNSQYTSQGTFNPVRSVRVRGIQGVIHKLEFLYPRPEDDYHIILLLIVTRKERSSGEPVSRMITYEWELGDSLKETFAAEKAGNRLPKEHRMPSLLIPLRFNTAFFAVSQPDIGVVKNCLSGSPVFEVLETDTPSRTPLHHGAEKPLWTAWSRPFRRKKYFEKTDIIYVAREDGAIIHVEIDAPELVPSVTNVGCLDTNINTAFTIAYDVFSDVLIIGGDSGPGGIWKLAPRTDLEQISVLPNWSPVVDMATSSWRPNRNDTASDNHSLTATDLQAKKALVKPDSLFSASGRGLKGTVTQWRWGIQGRIGLDIESGEPIRRSWGFSINGLEGGELFGLLALPHSSILLQFSADFSQVSAVESGATAFDLSSRTLHACQTRPDVVVQATESSISVVSPNNSSRNSIENLLGQPAIIAENAHGVGEAIVLSTHSSGQSQLHSLSIEGTHVQHVSTWDVEGEITCVSLFAISDKYFVAVGSVVGGNPCISAYSLNGTTVVARSLTNDPASQNFEKEPSIEPLTSISVVRDEAGTADFIAGTRCGRLLTIRISDQYSDKVIWETETIGISPVDVSSTLGHFDGGIAALVCCDNHLLMLSEYSAAKLKFQKKNFIWLTDSSDPAMPSPPVHSVFQLGKSLSEYAGHKSLMLLAGSRLLLADIWPHFALVPRSLSLDGTPTRVIYSQTWNCLIVSLLRDDRPTLAFIDVDTGLDISAASDKDKNPSEFISGLGNAGDRIYGLCEWLYVKDGKTFAFLLVTTRDGKLLIVSVNKADSQRHSSDRKTRILKYWTRYKKAMGKPIYAIVGDKDGIIFCVDRTIHWDVLDLTEKKLRPMKHYELDSPAISLRVSDGKIFALTTMHSLEILDHRAGDDGDMALIHTDCVARTTVHMTRIGHDTSENGGDWPVTLLSDHRGGIAGVWVPWGQRNKEFEVIFESQLPTSIRRFSQARSRPLWLGSERRNCYGAISSSEDGAEVFGVSLDGSLRHFTLVNLELWRLLSLVQNLARRRPDIDCMDRTPSESDVMDDDDDMDIEPRMHPKLMHIDGDLLEQCHRRRLLERVVGNGDGLDLFCEYLDGLAGGKYTDDFRDDIGNTEEQRHAAYFKVGYDILDYLLAPVL